MLVETWLKRPVRRSPPSPPFPLPSGHPPEVRPYPGLLLQDPRDLLRRAQPLPRPQGPVQVGRLLFDARAGAGRQVSRQPILNSTAFNVTSFFIPQDACRFLSVSCTILYVHVLSYMYIYLVSPSGLLSRPRRSGRAKRSTPSCCRPQSGGGQR